MFLNKSQFYVRLNVDIEDKIGPVRAKQKKPLDIGFRCGIFINRRLSPAAVDLVRPEALFNIFFGDEHDQKKNPYYGCRR